MNLDKLKSNLSSLGSEELDVLFREIMPFCDTQLADWTPYDKQKQLHLSNKKVRLFIGSNRSGKSEWGTVESLYHATLKYPEWYPKENRLTTPSIGRIVVSDFSKGFSMVLQKKLAKWLPKNMIKEIRKNHEGWPERYFLRNGSMFDVCTHQQSPDVYEGWNGHWVWFDEPPPRYAYVGSFRGLVDWGGRIWMTMTPMNEPWIYDELIASNKPYIDVVEAVIYDNPYLSRSEIAMFKDTLREDEQGCRLLGKFMHLTGLVYKNIKPHSHYVTLNLDDKDSPASRLKKIWYFVLDPHDRRPHCGIWAYVSPNNKIHIAYEMQSKGTITELSAYIRVFEKDHQIYNPIRIGDPNKLESPNAINGLKLKDEFAKYGIYFDTRVDDSISRGHMAVREKLYYDESKPIDGLNSPNLLFSENVPLTKEMFSKYIYQEWKGALRDSKNDRETPKDINKDLPDCTRYLVMKRPVYWDELSEMETKKDYPSSFTGY